MCCDRLNISFECKNIINDIRACYPDLQTKYITEAIKQGSMGVYGRTYRFSFQEVSIWIREYKKNNRTNLNSGGVSMEELYNAGNND